MICIHQILGEPDEDMVCSSGPGFITQFPYKSCQRSNTPRKRTGHHWPNNKPPTTVPRRRVSIKRKKYAGNNNSQVFSAIENLMEYAS